jgi:potassium efflux system protein
MMSRFRNVAHWRVLVMGALALLCASAGFAQSSAPPLETTRTMIEAAEATLQQQRLSPETFDALRETIVQLRNDLSARIAQLEPQVAQADVRLKQIGPAPAAGAPPEEPAVTTERAQIAKVFSESDGALKQARLLLLRVEQVSDQIAERRQAIFARRLFRYGGSALDPSLWMKVVAALPSYASNVGDLGRSFVDAVRASPLPQTIAAFALLFIFAFGISTATRWWRRRFTRELQSHTRLGKALAGLWFTGSIAIRLPLITFACVKVLQVFGLLSAELSTLGLRLIIAAGIASAGRGIAVGLFAPNRPQRRLLPFDDATVHCLHDHIVWGARALAAAALLQGIHKAASAPPVLTTVTSIFFAAAIVGILVHMVLRLRRIQEETEQTSGLPVWIRPIGWLFAAVIAAALIAGYARFATFLSVRLLATVAVVSIAYLLIQAADALLTEAIGENTPRGRTIASNLGVSPRNIELVGTILSAGFRVVVILLALLLVVGPWEVTTSELSEALQGLSLQFTVGDLTISFRAILGAAVMLGLTLFATRAMRRWLETSLLPRTAIEPSLQLSIATMFGYLGIIVGVTLALSALGIDLQKIAFVASALAVGIGFGLQSVVSNFVSGLILLAERPIRVGDSIVVQGEEGWVRRIRVRATEIETFERASVIIPNSALITGMVKNWTHANTMSRITIKVGVGYDSDPELVRNTLVTLASEHPQVTKTSPPRAYLVSFGDTALEFELRCIVANVENGLAVRSDLNVTILKAFRAAGIAIPVPQREIRARREEEERTPEPQKT